MAVDSRQHHDAAQYQGRHPHTGEFPITVSNCIREFEPPGACTPNSTFNCEMNMIAPIPRRNRPRP